MNALNTRNGKQLSSNVRTATGVVSRMKGLLGKKELGKGESLLIKPCKSVHTIGMRFPIDIVFLDKGNNVITLRTLPPNRITGIYLKAVSVLELKAGTLTATDTRLGDRLAID